MHVDVKETLGSEYAITLDDGQFIFDRIYPELAAGSAVEVDFSKVEVTASPFFNAAIGQLLRDLEPDDLSRLLKVTGLRPEGDAVMRLVIENAKRYYHEPEYRRAVDQVLQTMVEDRVERIQDIRTDQPQHQPQGISAQPRRRSVQCSGTGLDGLGRNQTSR